jgi:hypothetical protein
MKIEDKIEKYLKEGMFKQKDNKFKKTPPKKAVDKVIKTIKSAKTDAQLKNAQKMIYNLVKVYDPEYIMGPKADIEDVARWGTMPEYGALWQLWDIVKAKKLDLEHMKEVQRMFQK